MSEKFPHQPAPEATDKNTLLKELNSKKTRELVLAHILSMKTRLSSADIEDIVQQVMFKAVRAIKADKFKRDSKLTTWLYIITKNEALMLLRKQKRRLFEANPLTPSHKPISEGPTSEESYITAETAKNLRSHFNKLSPKLREVLELLLGGLNNKQIAERLGINLNTIKNRQHRAHQLLKEWAQNEDQK